MHDIYKVNMFYNLSLLLIKLISRYDTDGMFSNLTAKNFEGGGRTERLWFIDQLFSDCLNLRSQKSLAEVSSDEHWRESPTILADMPLQVDSSSELSQLLVAVWIRKKQTCVQIANTVENRGRHVNLVEDLIHAHKHLWTFDINLEELLKVQLVFRDNRRRVSNLEEIHGTSWVYKKWQVLNFRNLIEVFGS